VSYAPPRRCDHVTGPLRAVGVIGLGKMGAPMARHLLNGGFSVIGYDIRSDALKAFEKRGGTTSTSPSEMVAAADVVLTSLPSVDALANVMRASNGVLASGSVGLTVIETSTFAPATKEAFRVELEAAGMIMLDCTISGTAAQMATRDVAVYASGRSDVLRSYWPVLAAFSRAQYDVGRFGNGAKLKLISNLLVTVHNAAAAEALVLAERCGLDPARSLEALVDGAGTSRMLEIRGPMMASKDYSRASARLDEYMKDIDLISAFGEDSDSPLPLFRASMRLYYAALAAGLGSEDHAAVAAVLATLDGTSLC
jgi:putative dehydrogenase